MASAEDGCSSDVVRFKTRPCVRRWTSRTSSNVKSLVRGPTTTLLTGRCSASSAPWSQQSPQPNSPGLQCFCFLPAKDHFSSNRTAVVLGGKSHELVVEGFGVV